MGVTSDQRSGSRSQSRIRDIQPASGTTDMKAALAVTILLLSTVSMSAAPTQERDGQIRGVVVDSSGRPAAGQ